MVEKLHGGCLLWLMMVDFCVIGLLGVNGENRHLEL